MEEWFLDRARGVDRLRHKSSQALDGLAAVAAGEGRGLIHGGSSAFGIRIPWNSTRKSKPPQKPLTTRLQGFAAGVFRLRAELFLDAQQLIVFRGAVGAGKRAGLDLPAIGGDR